MAVGRGQLLRSFMDGLQMLPQVTPLTEYQIIDTLTTVQLEEDQSQRSSGGTSASTEEQDLVGRSAYRLPFEVLMKILSYLDTPSLISISHVSKLFHSLANDDVMWQNIYTSEFGSRMWKPRLADSVAGKAEQDQGDLSAGNWRRMYFRALGGQEVKRWREQLRETHPYTNLPKQTEAVLRDMKVTWALNMSDHTGQKTTVEQSRVHFFESSLVVCWSVHASLDLGSICSIQLDGVRTGVSGRKPTWRSLLLRVSTDTHPCVCAGADALVKVLLLPGVALGAWRGNNRVAFVMVSLHYHTLVEKILLGSPVCPYTEPVEPAPIDDLDPEFGLHGYALHLVLHNSDTKIMSGHFSNLCCHAVPGRRHLQELRVISTSDLSKHRLLPDRVRLLWRSNQLKGAVENVCFMSLTLLDIHRKPFWCVSSPVHFSRPREQECSAYSGADFRVDFQHPGGEVTMRLVWLERQRQFLLHGLQLRLPVDRINQRFSRGY